MSYQTTVQKLIMFFSYIQFEHMSGAHNKENALAILASKIQVPNEAIDMRIIKKTLRATTKEVIPTNPIDEQDCGSIIHNVIHQWWWWSVGSSSMFD